MPVPARRLLAEQGPGTFDPIPSQRQQNALELVRRAQGAIPPAGAPIQPVGGGPAFPSLADLRTQRPEMFGPKFDERVAQGRAAVGAMGSEGTDIYGNAAYYSAMPSFSGGAGSISDMMQKKREELAARGQQMYGGGGPPMAGIPPGEMQSPGGGVPGQTGSGYLGMGLGRQGPGTQGGWQQYAREGLRPGVGNPFPAPGGGQQGQLPLILQQLIAMLRQYGLGV